MQRRIKAELGRDRGERGLTLEAAAIDRLQALNAKLFRAPDAIAVLTETMDAARTLLDAQMGSAELYDPETGELELVAARGFAFELPSDARKVKPGSGSICALALEARRQVVLEDILAEPRCEAVHAASRMAGIRGALATPLFDHAGTVIAVVSVYFTRPHRPAEDELRILDLLLPQATHLVERFFAEDALRSSERQFAALFEQAACGIASVDLEGRLKMVNDRFCEILGRTRAELLTQRVIDLTHPDDVPRNLELLDRALKEGRPYAMEKRYLRGDGMEVWVSVDVSPLCDARGLTVATMGICQDITQRKQTEQALREADRRKDEFLATLAHELRNPLSPIVNGLELLTGEGRDPVFFDDIHATLTRQTRQMVRLVDDLLDVSRITRGKIELRVARIDVAAIVASAAETARPIIDAAGHELTISLSEEPLIVNGDASRLSQVLANLLNNAAKYTDPGGKIVISVHRERGDAVVSVLDGGIGIPPELLEPIFELFVQADQSLERSSGGLGIGLTLVKRLVDMHGGSVLARSGGPGRGSEFVVRLPLDVDQSFDRPAPSEPHHAIPPRRVLVVDDNPSVLKSMCLLLRSLGHDARGASDGLGGLEVGREFRPEVVLLDLAMPKCNGFDTARRLREEPWGRDVVLVALTGWGLEEHRQRTKAAGFDYHFVKPIDGRQLQMLLGDLRVPSAS